MGEEASFYDIFFLVDVLISSLWSLDHKFENTFLHCNEGHHVVLLMVNCVMVRNMEIALIS
jgi:hypothetical protein